MSRSLVGRRAAMLAATAAGLVAAATAPAARAALPAPHGCEADTALSQPFAAWGDTNDYRALPGSDFADGAPGWTLSGGASIASPGASTAPTGASLSLPAGATAQSPYTCVDVTQPTFRFFDTADAPGSVVLVSVVYRSPLGPAAVPAGTVNGSGDWQPSPQYRNGAAIAGLLNGGTAEMAVRFTALTGATRVDDVFVDPRMSWVI